jgi:hypothetical protein
MDETRDRPEPGPAVRKLAGALTLAIRQATHEEVAGRLAEHLAEIEALAERPPHDDRLDC